MKLTPVLSSLFAAAALTACGSAGSLADFRAAAPTSEKIAISEYDGDPIDGVAAADPSSATAVEVARPECHPHLFVRTHEIIGRLNRHFAKHLHHVEELIEDNPLTNGQSKTWENVRAGVDRKFTMTRTDNLDGSVTYAFELDLAAAPASGATATFVKVMWGSITHVGPAESDTSDAGAQLVENKGQVTFDFDALASVERRERARGQITDTFDNVHDPAKGVKRSASVTLTNFLPEEGDPHGPRTGSYAWEREPSVGGKFRFEDTVALFCLPNPSSVESDVTTISRWYKASDGQVHGRSDSKATGGQLPAGDTWMGVTCAKGQTTAMPAEGFWMMKLEDGSGATVSSQSAQVGTEPCDTVFGAVPSATDNKTDYSFPTDFGAITFPGEW